MRHNGRRCCRRGSARSVLIAGWEARFVWVFVNLEKKECLID